MGSIGHRTGDKDAKAVLKRQDSVVLKEDCTFLCALLGRCKMLGGILNGGTLLYINIRMLKKAKLYLYPEDISYGSVNLGFLDFPAAHHFFKMADKTVGHHIHVNACGDSFLHSFRAVCCKAVINHLSHGVPVRDNKAVITPFSAEDILYNILVAGGRDAVIVIEGSHEGHCTSLYSCLKGREVNVTEKMHRDKGAIVVTPSFGSAVTYKMLDAGSH